MQCHLMCVYNRDIFFLCVVAGGRGLMGFLEVKFLDTLSAQMLAQHTPRNNKGGGGAPHADSVLYVSIWGDQ
jgi:hypothetical protein